MGEEKKSNTGLESNIAGLLSYVLGWITGLIFILVEQKDEFVRFHAMQSIVVFGAATVVMIAFGFLTWLPFIGILFLVIESLAGLCLFVLWILLMVRAYQGVRYKLPWAGDWAERYMPQQ